MTKTAETTELTTRQVAEQIGTDPKSLRVFLRNNKRGVGAGSRYEFTKADVPKLAKEFAAWTKERDNKREAAKAKSAEEKTKAAADSTPTEEQAEDVPDLEDVQEEKPAPKRASRTRKAA